MSEKNPYKYNGDALVVENINDNSKTKSVYIESYGCAMNFSDSEIVASILSKNGYKTSDDLYTAGYRFEKDFLLYFLKYYSRNYCKYS